VPEPGGLVLISILFVHVSSRAFFPQGFVVVRDRRSTNPFYPDETARFPFASIQKLGRSHPKRNDDKMALSTTFCRHGLLIAATALYMSFEF
jgi:hypothetical protein